MDLGIRAKEILRVAQGIATKSLLRPVIIVAVLDMALCGAPSKPAGPEVVGVCANHTCVAEGGSCEENEDCCFGHCDLPIIKVNGYYFNGGTVTIGGAQPVVHVDPHWSSKALVKSAPSKQFHYRGRNCTDILKQVKHTRQSSSCENARQGMRDIANTFTNNLTRQTGGF